MTRRVAPYGNAPTPAQWRSERRAAYRRQRGLALALVLLVLVALSLTIVAASAAASTSEATDGASTAAVLVLGYLAGTGVVLVGYLALAAWWRRAELRRREGDRR